MADLEKKFTDYQSIECEEFDMGEDLPQSEELCPTCQPNPNFKLEGNWWELEDAYLNEKYCEYHVRVYQNEKELKTKDEDGILLLAAERILVDLDKPLNDGTRVQVKNACYVKDKYRDIRSGELGEAYLVAVPAFNFDQIETNDSEDSDDESFDVGVDKIVLDTQGLFRKLRQLRWSIKAYGGFYSLAQGNRVLGKDKDTGFVIRQKANETARINYDWTAKKINDFVNSLNGLLRDNRYAKINRAGLFTAKRASKIKLVFSSTEGYDLSKLYVLPDDGCGKYQKITIPRSNPLRKKSMAVVFHFLANLDSIIKDITAKETKPWLDFTLEHFYPEYIVDYGNLEDIEETKAGLECLLEEQLGIGNGQVIDFLAKQVLSAFDSIEKDLNKQLCKNIGGKSVAQMASEKNGDNPTATEERKQKMIARYEKEFTNHATKEIVKYANDFIQSILLDERPVDKTNMFEKMKEYAIPFVEVFLPQYSYVDKATKQKIQANLGTAVIIYDREDIERNATMFAEAKHENLSQGGFGNKIQNSPHYQEFLEASTEVIKNPKNDFIQGYRDAMEGLEEFDLLDAISAFGICGLTSLTGKALQCLLGGVTFDQFLGMLVEKSFDFMELNTLSLFLNGLPADFRRELDETIEEQFGDVSLTDLLELKKAEGGNQKLKDFVKSKQKFKLVYEKLESLKGTLPEGEDLIFLKEHLPEETIDGYSLLVWNTIDPERIKEIPKDKLKKEKKALNKQIKKDFRKFKREKRSFKNAVDRIGAATRGAAASVLLAAQDLGDKIEESPYGQRRELRRQIDEVRDLIKAEEESVNDLFSGQQISFTPDGQIENLPSSSEFVQEELSKISSRIVDYKFVEADLVAQLDQASSVEQRLANFEEGFNSIGSSEDDEENLDPYESAVKSFEETAVGVKVDAVFDVVFDFVIDSIMDSFGLDDLFERLSKFPVVDFVGSKIKDFMTSCPTKPLFYPPIKDFMKSFSVDLCDPSISLTLPKISIPSINLRFLLETNFSEIFREAIIKLVTDIILKLLTRLLSLLEGALCNLLEAAGGFAADALKNGLPSTLGGLHDGFVNALNEAFCNDGENPETAKSKAEELAAALFSPALFDSNLDYEGSGAKVSNIVSSVASTNEFLEAMVAKEGEENVHFNNRIANAISTLSPEMSVLLGDPSQVAYFFRNLGSYLSPEDQDRIRDLLDAGIPNLPVSPAICLTNDQLNAWNDLRNGLLQEQGLTPQQANEWVDKLNEETEKALDGVLDDIGDLNSAGEPFLGALTNELARDACNPNNVINETSESSFDREQSEEFSSKFL
jgi:hypothetical protein